MTDRNGADIDRAVGVPTLSEEALLAELCVAAARADDPLLYVAVARLNNLQPTVTLAFLYQCVKIALASTPEEL